MIRAKIILYMAFCVCSYAALFDNISPCGSSSDNAQYVVIGDCKRDAHSHIKSLKIGLEEEVFDESTLLLARAGKNSTLLIYILLLLLFALFFR